MIARSLFILLATGVVPLLAGDKDWRGTLTSPTPGAFPPLRPLVATYTFGWNSLNAAEVKTEYSRTEDGLLQLHVTGGSIGVARALWKMDTDSTSIVRANSLRPVNLVQEENYSDESRQTTVVFTDEGAERTRKSKPAGKDSGKTKKFKFTPVFDLHSALLFIRSQPLEEGDRLRIVTYPTDSAYLTDVEVLGRESIKVGKTKRPAIKVSLRLKEISRKMKLSTHKKFKSASAWISDDEDRLLLRIEAEVMIGKVWMALEKVEFE